MSDTKNRWQSLPLWRRIFYGGLALLLLYALLDLAVMPLYTRQAQSIDVPTVIGMEEGAANRLLIDHGLVPVKALEKFDEEFRAGQVIFQSPGSELPVKKGRRVYLTLSKGRRIFAMPRLTGMSERDARFAVEEAEMVISHVSYRTDPFLPDGVVCAQSMEAGQEVTIGTRISLVVSLGVEPTEFIVPELVGKSQQDAEHLLLKAGLALGTLTAQTTAELLPKTIISQSIPAGTVVNKGDAVDLVVSMLPE